MHNKPSRRHLLKTMSAGKLSQQQYDTHLLLLLHAAVVASIPSYKSNIMRRSWSSLVNRVEPTAEVRLADSRDLEQACRIPHDWTQEETSVVTNEAVVVVTEMQVPEVTSNEEENEVNVEEQVLSEEHLSVNEEAAVSDASNEALVENEHAIPEAAVVPVTTTASITTTEEVNAEEGETGPSDVVPPETDADDGEEDASLKRKPCWRWSLIAATLSSLIVVAVVVVVVVLVVVVTNNNKSSAPAPPPQEQQSPPLDTAYLQEIRSILVPPSLWTDTNAPQLRATEFMAFSSKRVKVTSPRLFQRYALLTIYFSNGGERWPLDPSLHECEWLVVECNSQEVVQKLYMGNQLDMTGTLPAEIGLLTHVHYLDLEKNRLEGPLPETLYELSNLVVLRLSSNRFASTISDAMGTLTNLETLYLRDNFFDGTLPMSLYNLTRLQRVLLQSNLFTGSVLHFLPSWREIGKCIIEDYEE